MERLLIEDDYDCEWLLRNKQEDRCNRLLREFIATTKQLQSLNNNTNNNSNSKSYWSNK